MPHLEELKGPVLQGQKLVSIVICEIARETERVTTEHRVLRVGNRFSVRRYIRLRGVPKFLPVFSERRHFGAQLYAILVVSPISRKVMRIERHVRCSRAFGSLILR